MNCDACGRRLTADDGENCLCCRCVTEERDALAERMIEVEELRCDSRGRYFWPGDGNYVVGQRPATTPAKAEKA